MQRPRIREAAFLYGALLVAAGLWAGWQGRLGSWVAAEGWLRVGVWQSHGLSLLLGAAVMVVAVRGTKVLVVKTVWARQLHEGFRELLDFADNPPRRGELLFFALSSGIAEELFFRGAMQSAWGWLVASLVFGALHLGPDRRFWPWTLQAIGIGLVFGLVVGLTGSLVGVVFAHVGINYRNLLFLWSHDPAMGSLGKAPSLVLARQRVAGRAER